MQVMEVGLSIVAMRRAPKTPAQAVPSVPAPPSGQSSATSSAPKTPACAAVPPVSFCIAPVCMLNGPTFSTFFRAHCNDAIMS